MNRYGKLLNWEIVRFSKFYGALLVITLFSQFFGIWLEANSYMNRAEEMMDRNSISAVQYAAQYGKTSITNGYSSIWIEGSISLCAASLLLYIFLIWYKEWFGKSTFAYRLLMLPTSRMNVYLAKLSTIVLFVLGLIAFQLMLVPIHISVFDAMIPGEFRQDVPIPELIHHHPLLKMLAPKYFIEFVLYYGAGAMGVVVLFTAILLERSFRYKGIAAGILYSVAALLLILLPVIIAEVWVRNYLFPSEVLLLQIIIGICITGLSLWFSSYLLRKKVTI
ncbi:hypothetical protein QFZ77_006954 [Paenibacillus sp. V4I3]|uniref:hypothetical protein n=1 Tax=unclassified Paenibacillus TaxID=185978 RepID=UPI00278615D4|nr:MULTISPECIES: hypothetical protein [unclassified Paenibacillus]MDQ0878295.1 hypothetical protein [Paenibacillus sp. V4I3]MDQ0885851.1 hypothetical protein [Paenibacillus sp. V4I9]